MEPVSLFTTLKCRVLLVWNFLLFIVVFSRMKYLSFYHYNAFFVYFIPVPFLHLFTLIVVITIFSFTLLSHFFYVNNSINIIELFQYSVCEFSLAFHNDYFSFPKSFILKIWSIRLIDSKK